MNILFLSQIVPYPPHGGVLQRGYNLIREMSRYNSVDLLAFVHPEVLNSSHAINAAKEELKKYCVEVDFFDLWVKKSILNKYCGLLISLFSTLPFSVHAYSSKDFRRKIFEWTEEKAFDIVHYDTISLCQFDLGAKQIPKILTHHNIESKLMARRSRFEKRPLVRSYFIKQTEKLKKYEAKESGKHDVNIVMSDTDGEELKKINPEVNLAVVPNGVDTEYFVPGTATGEPSLIYTGGMNMFANKDAVLYFLKDIWPSIKAKEPMVKFYAIGQDPPAELMEIGKSDHQVIITGYVDDVRPYVADSSVYVVPLRVGGGTRLKVLDAMAMGKAIVSTSIGCEGLKVSDGKNIVISDKPDDFAEKTVTLLKNQDKRTSLGRAARELAISMYSWQKIGRLLQDVYETTAMR